MIDEYDDCAQSYDDGERIEGGNNEVADREWLQGAIAMSRVNW